MEKPFVELTWALAAITFNRTIAAETRKIENCLSITFLPSRVSQETIAPAFNWLPRKIQFTLFRGI
jgi:hypothetical protein